MFLFGGKTGIYIYELVPICGRLELDSRVRVQVVRKYKTGGKGYEIDR